MKHISEILAEVLARSARLQAMVDHAEAAVFVSAAPAMSRIERGRLSAEPARGDHRRGVSLSARERCIPLLWHTQHDSGRIERRQA